jgi:hypothetical protein
MRAVIPTPDNQAFTKKPVSNVDIDLLKQERRDKNPSSLSRMNANMARMNAKMRNRS